MEWFIEVTLQLLSSYRSAKLIYFELVLNWDSSGWIRSVIQLMAGRRDQFVYVEVTCFMKAAVPVLSVRQRLLHTMPDGNHNAIAPFNTFKAPSMPHCVLLLAARCFMRKTQARVPWIEQFCIIRIEAYLNWQHHRLLLDTFTTHLHEADK